MPDYRVVTKSVTGNTYITSSNDTLEHMERIAEEQFALGKVTEIQYRVGEVWYPITRDTF